MQQYAEYLLGLGLAPSTVRMYRAAMRKAAVWAYEEGVDLLDASPSELSRLRDKFVESNSTLRQLRCALQHYWEFQGVDYGPVKALRVPKKPRYEWRGLEDTEARQLAHMAAGWHPEGTATLVGLFTGLRRSEIAAMRWDRFNHDMTKYRVMGKGQVEATVPVVAPLRSMLRPVQGGFVWLFPGERRLHVSPATIWEWIGRVAEEAGLPHITPHQLRHTAVNRIYRVSGDPVKAQGFARHTRLDTTEVYLQSARFVEVAEAAEEALDWLKPRGVEDVA